MACPVSLAGYRGESAGLRRGLIIDDLPPDAIRLNRIRLAGRHGVTDEEASQEQAIEVDLEVRSDLCDAGQSDDPGSTFDYAVMHRIATEVITGPRKHLGEALAEEIADRVLVESSMDFVRVVVRKMSPPLFDVAGGAEVEILRRRQK